MLGECVKNAGKWTEFNNLYRIHKRNVGFYDSVAAELMSVVVYIM